MDRIAIVNSSSFGKYFPEQLNRLKKIGPIEFFKFPSDINPKELAETLKDYNYIIASVTPFFTKEFFENHPGVKLLTRHGIGYNNVDVTSATGHNCYVTIVEGIVEQDAVAENAIAHLMNSTRQLKCAAEAAENGEWKRRAEFMGYQIRHKTAGVIGFGNIGSRVGSILKEGFKCRLLAYDPYLSDEQLKEKGAIPVSLEELLRESDIISLNAFVNDKSYHLIKHEQIQQMKDHVMIVNTARGELVDDRAIIQAVIDRKIFSYGTDVVEGEPIDSSHPLFSSPFITVTPHTSAYTYECLEGMGEKCVSDCEKVAAGEVPLNLINKELIELVNQ